MPDSSSEDQLDTRVLSGEKSKLQSNAGDLWKVYKGVLAQRMLQKVAYSARNSLHHTF